MVINPQYLCTRALRTIGAASVGTVIEPEDMQTAYDTLQEIMNAWKVDDLTILVTERVITVATVGKGTFENPYTIGPGGDIDRQRPVWLNNGSCIFNNNPQQPNEQPFQVLTVEEYQQIPVKNTRSGAIEAAYYDHSYGSNDGLGRIYLWPVPNVTNISFALYCPTALDEFTSLTQNVDMPPGYIRALRYVLAVDLMDEYGSPDNADKIMKKAETYLGDVRRANIKPVIIGVDQAIISRGDRWNWLTGSYQR